MPTLPRSLPVQCQCILLRGQRQSRRIDTRMRGLFSGRRESRTGLTRAGLVVAARAKHVEDHQLRIREKPLLCFGARGSRRANQRAEMLQLCQVSEVLKADSCDSRNLVFGENLLT